mgnify:CR=1 FL=1
MKKPLRVLIVEDSDDDCLLMVRELQRGGFAPEWQRVENAAEMHQALQEKEWEVILADFVLPRFGGLAALQITQELGLDIPLIIVSGTIGEETAVNAMRMGAHDYIMKDRLTRLPAAIERELAEVQVRRERRRAEEALRESEDLYRTLFELESDAIVIIENASGRLLAANQAASDLYGYSKEELLALKNTDLSAEPEETRSVTVATPINSHHTVYVPLRYHRHKDGHVFPVEITGRFFIWRGQEVHIAAIRDISERVRTDQLLRALNRASLAMAQAMTGQAVFEAAAAELHQIGLHCIILALDAENGLPEQPSQVTCKLVFASYAQQLIEQVQTTFRLSLHSVTFPIQPGTLSYRVIVEKEPVLESIAEVLKTIFYPDDEQQAQALSRFIGVRQFIAVPLMIDGRVWGILAVLANDLRPADLSPITAFANQIAAAWHKADLLHRLQENLEELKRTQDQLIQAQKMEAVGRLAGGIAHDFNNHLTAILGYAEMLYLELDARDTRRQDVLEIRRAAERSAALTRQLLAFSRRQIVRPVVLNLNDLLRNIDGMLRRLIGEDIDLQIRLADDLGMILADPGQIEQVIMNLSVNARDAMPNGGQLIIQTTNIDLDEGYVHEHFQVQPSSYVLLSVTDTGTGMTPEVQSHLFEPFFTTKAPGKGTGLGLATVYGIVKQSGGHISVYSEPGLGSTFKIYLPRTDAPQPQREYGEPIGQQACGNETILVVEDEDAVRNMAAQILTQSGYTVLQASSPETAVEIAATHNGPIHLVLTDVVMPGKISSQKMVQHLLASRPEMRVLYMSGYTEDLIADRGVLAAGMHLLDKPFSLHTLTQQVRRVLDEPA